MVFNFGIIFAVVCIIGRHFTTFELSCFTQTQLLQGFDNGH